MIRRKLTTPRGFTLIELIVSVGIFAIIMLAATSAYLNLIALDRQARATNSIVNNLSFTVDSMMRGMRTGTNFQCIDPGGAPDSNGNSTNGRCTCFSYMDSYLGQTVSYHLEANNTIGRAVGSATCLDSASDSITDPTITIPACSGGVCGLAFYVRGVGGSTNDLQPQVLFTISGTIATTSRSSATNFVIESGATQRLIDL